MLTQQRGGQALRHRRRRRPDADRHQPGAASRDFQIGGVLRDIPKNSHLRINAIVRLDFPSFIAEDAAVPDLLGLPGRLGLRQAAPGRRPGRDPAPALPAWEKRNIPDENAGEARFNAGDDQDWHLVNVRDVHLGKAQAGAMSPGNDRRTIVTFAVIALLILGMAVVNFTNLATARASQRAREVALRKVLGANRRQLIVQFIGESMLIAVLAMLIALALVELLLPPFSAFLDADLELSYFGADGIVLPVLAAGAGRRRARRPLPGLLPVALPAGARCSRPTSRRPRRRASGGCAARSSSASSRCRSASSSAPRSSTARPSTPAPSIPATSATASSRSTSSAATS